MSGKHLTGTVIYGYLWDEKREHWLADEEAAAVVRRIFAMTLAGYGPYQIATQLTQDRVEISSVHLARFNEGVNRTTPVKDIYGWGSSAIVHILKKREYPGHTVNFKICKHFKDKKAMPMKVNGRFLKILMTLLSTRKPLTTYSAFGKYQAIPEQLGRGRAADKADVLRRLRRENVCPLLQ